MRCSPVLTAVPDARAPYSNGNTDHSFPNTQQVRDGIIVAAISTGGNGEPALFMNEFSVFTVRVLGGRAVRRDFGEEMWQRALAFTCIDR